MACRPPRRFLHSRLTPAIRRGLFTLAASVLAACGDAGTPGGPEPERPVSRIPFGTPVEGSIVAGDTALSYSILPSYRTVVTFRFAASNPVFQLLVTDSTTGTAVVVMNAVDDPGPTRTDFSAPSTSLVGGRVYLVRVRAQGGVGTFWWDPAPQPAQPEWNPELLPLGDTVRELFEAPGDIDAFTHEAPSGEELVIHYRPTSVSATPPPVYSPVPWIAVVNTLGDTVARQYVSMNYRDLELRPLTVALPAAGRYRIVAGITSSGPLPGDAAYELLVRRLQRAPEHRGAAIALGDTVLELLDYNGDVDEFLLSGTTGDEFNVFIETSFADSASGLVVELVPPSGPAYEIGSGTAGQTLRQSTSGVRRLDATGGWKVRVTSSCCALRLHRGPYRLVLYPIDRGPETVVATPVIGDSVAGEAIDDLGDIDEFAFTVPQSTGMTMVLVRPQPGPGLVARLIQTSPESTFNARELWPDTIPLAVGAGRFSIPAGQYVLRVQSDGTPGGYTGPWLVRTYGSLATPESAPAVFSIGDTIGESLEVPGDLDEYIFAGTEGQFVTLAASTQAASPYTWEVALSMSGGGLVGMTPPTGRGFDASRSARVRLPFTRNYNAVVRHDGFEPGTPGAYRFFVAPYATTPETAPAALAVGDSVGTESLDQLGDIDDFVLTGTPGTAFRITISLGRPPRLEVLDASRDSVLAAAIAVTGANVTGRVVMPANGTVRVRAFEDVPAAFYATGPYWFKVEAVP